VKRSEALASLSRDHQQALAIAQKLRRATPETATDVRAAFLSYWIAHGRTHFRLEEEVLLPAYAGYGDAHDPLVLRVLGDHVAIRQRADALTAPTTLALEALHELGVRLAAHVRLEERELFPLIERAVPAPELLRVARAIEAHHD
jgi:hemerythrin-like domain-containing protein